jgi:hypothetical protein
MLLFAPFVVPDFGSLGIVEPSSVAVIGAAR